jgi:NDP-mannose synthase
VKAVILAGGLGARLRPFTEAIPKPLLPIGEKAVLEIQIARLKGFGVDEIFLATNYKSEYVESFFGDGSRYGVRLRISREEEPLGTAGPLSLLRKELTEPFIVMNGDILSLIDFGDLTRFAAGTNAALTVVIKKEVLPFAFGNIFFEGDYVTEVQEKPNIVMYVVAGIYMMTPEILSLIPDKTYFGIDSLIKAMLKSGRPVAKYDLKEYWLDIGRLNDYEEAQHAYERHFK